MESEQKVAVITGASQGVGASLVQGFREIGYGVLANSRSIKATHFGDDPAILTVDGDIAVPGDHSPHHRRGHGALRPDRHAGKQRWPFHL